VREATALCYLNALKDCKMQEICASELEKLCGKCNRACGKVLADSTASRRHFGHNVFYVTEEFKSWLERKLERARR
jgi:hypothetical protein